MYGINRYMCSEYRSVDWVIIDIYNTTRSTQ